MPDLNGFLSASGKIDSLLGRAFDDAETVGRRITERSSSIVIQRDGSSNLAAQTVRIEAVGFPGGLTGNENMMDADRMVMVIGYKNHPTVTDTNIQAGDFFVHESRRFEVTEIVPNFNDRIVAKAIAK